MKRRKVVILDLDFSFQIGLKGYPPNLIRETWGGVREVFPKVITKGGGFDYASPELRILKIETPRGAHYIEVGTDYKGLAEGILAGDGVFLLRKDTKWEKRMSRVFSWDLLLWKGRKEQYSNPIAEVGFGNGGVWTLWLIHRDLSPIFREGWDEEETIRELCFNGSFRENFFSSSLPRQMEFFGWVERNHPKITRSDAFKKNKEEVDEAIRRNEEAFPRVIDALCGRIMEGENPIISLLPCQR